MAGNLEFLNELETIIRERIQSNNSDSYVHRLVHSGLDRILKKIGEEAGEVIIACKNDIKHDTLNESADLLFHLMLALNAQGHSIQDVVNVLKQRHDD